MSTKFNSECKRYSRRNKREFLTPFIAPLVNPQELAAIVLQSAVRCPENAADYSNVFCALFLFRYCCILTSCLYNWTQVVKWNRSQKCPIGCWYDCVRQCLTLKLTFSISLFFAIEWVRPFLTYLHEYIPYNQYQDVNPRKKSCLESPVNTGP